MTATFVARLRTRRIRILLTVLAVLAGAGSVFVPAGRAHALLPDKWAYGYHDPGDPVPGPMRDSLTSAGVAGNVVSVGGNSYVVSLPGVNAAQGVVHVTAISKTGNPTPQPASWCQPDDWFQAGGNEIVKVSCWAVSGGVAVPFPTGFAVTWVSATYSGPPQAVFAYAQSDGAGALLSQYDSAGIPLAVSHLATGVWTIKLPGVGPGGTGLSGNLQVTGEGTGSPVRCKVGDWKNGGGTQLPTVLCFNGSGAPVDTRWALTYSYKVDLRGLAPAAWGVFWQHSGAPITTNFDSVTGWGTVTSGGMPPAGITVLFPGIGPSATPYSGADVTAFGPGPGFCRFGELGGPPPWYDHSGVLQLRSVDCFDGSGAPLPTDFFAAYTAQ